MYIGLEHKEDFYGYDKNAADENNSLLSADTQTDEPAFSLKDLLKDPLKDTPKVEERKPEPVRTEPQKPKLNIAIDPDMASFGSEPDPPPKTDPAKPQETTAEPGEPQIDIFEGGEKDGEKKELKKLKKFMRSGRTVRKGYFMTICRNPKYKPEEHVHPWTFLVFRPLEDSGRIG